jgi:FkbM family methyltransferase
MNHHRNLWWPDYEGAEKMYRYMIKRVTDIDVSLKRVRSLGVCVQAGGHVGLWARRLARHFEEVNVFEPVPELYDCLKMNTAHLPNVIPRNEALGETAGEVLLTVLPSGRSNLSGTVKAGDLLRTVATPVVTIDDLALVRCDALFLDVERHELEVLRGAKRTIKEFNPTITLELLPDQENEYMAYMIKLGYRHAGKIHNDHIFTRHKE